MDWSYSTYGREQKFIESSGRLNLKDRDICVDGKIILK
jgi:hypothetical protein